MIHCYKLGGMNIVLDICSGSVHVVDEVAYDIIALYQEKSREEIIALTTAVMEMYYQWLIVPKTIEKEMKNDGKGRQKNAEMPTRRSRRS